MSDHSRKPSRVTIALGVLLGILVLVLGVLLAVDSVLRGRVDAALERVRAAGEPVFVAELSERPQSELSPSGPWLSEIAQAARDGALFEEPPLALGGWPEQLAAVDDQARLALLDGFTDCRGAELAPDDWEVCERELDAARRPDPCVLRLVAAGYAPILELARRSTRYAPLPHARHSRPFPVSGVGALRNAAHALQWNGVLAAVQGDTELASRDLVQGARLTRLVEDPQSLIEFVTWWNVWTPSLVALRHGLPHLPVEVDLRLFEEELARADVRATLASCVIGERAFLNTGLSVSPGWDPRTLGWRFGHLYS